MCDIRSAHWFVSFACRIAKFRPAGRFGIAQNLFKDLRGGKRGLFSDHMFGPHQATGAVEGGCQKMERVPDLEFEESHGSRAA